MCGVAGLWNMALDGEALKATAGRMAQALKHRGPDAQTVAQGAGWALGHARLSIIDLEKGTQPMWNEDRTIALIGNNEIYNFKELRKELEACGHRFASRCDTEVALHGWEEWGEACFSKFNGMFAFAIIDTKKRRCILARDAMGIKPLHLTRIGSGFAFASEIKAFFEIPTFRTQPNLDAMHLFMNFRYVPDERTLFQGVERIEPGSLVILEGDRLTKKRYHSWERSSRTDSFADATQTLQSLLEAGVERHLIADVEVASYLSGGIDSSLITTLAVKKQPAIKSFCLAFGEPTDETSDAARLAADIGTTHQNLHVGDDPLARLSDILWHVEEPKVNCVQGFLLAEAVSAQVKVALSGLGGDDLFAGYVNNDYLFPMTLLRGVHNDGEPRTLSALQARVKSPVWDVYFRGMELGMNLDHPVAYYAILRNSFDHNPHLLSSLYAHPPAHWKNFSFEVLRTKFDAQDPDELNALLKLEARTKLANDFLLTEDRVSMAHSLEVRVPFLDKNVLEYAWALPSRMKYRPGQKKRILKAAAQPWLPSWVLEKKKWGFSFNPYLLFQGPLKKFVREVLTQKRVDDLGLFSWKWIKEVMEAPPSPKLRWHYFNLWVMAGFVLWQERFFGSRHDHR